MTRQTPNESPAATVSVARQAIFDPDRRLWGYELFCVGSADDTLSGVPRSDNIAISIAASAGVGLQQIITRKKRIIVNLTEKDLLDDQAYILPPERTTVQVSEAVFTNATVADNVAKLKADGFQVAVPDFSNSAECAALYELADIIGTDVRTLAPADRKQMVESAATYGAQALANQIQDIAGFDACRDAGFSLYQGAFSKAPEIVPLRKLSSGQVTRFQLLQVLESPDPDIPLLAENIQADAAISFRLLTYLNSAAFSFSQKIKSISHAVSMLGWQKMKSWLRLVLLSDMAQNEETSELLLTATQRAKFLELIAVKYPFWGFEPESLHLLGLFSLLDTMLGIPMDEIVTYLPMDGKLKAALCREPNSEYLPLLTLAGHLEDARWYDAEALVQQLNLDEAGTKAAFQEAVDWASELTVIIDMG